MRFTELKQHLATGKYFPCYLIVGEDAFLRASASDMFKGVIKSVPDLNLSIMTAPESDSLILEAAECLPLISDVRVLIVNDYFGDMTRIIKYLAAPNLSTVLVFVTEKLESNFSKAVNSMVLVDCAKLDSVMLKKWIAAKVKECGSSITDEAAGLLVEYTNSSLSRISSEAVKLASYRLDGVVQSADVAALVSAELDIKIFELSDAISAKQPERAARVLDNLLSAGTPIVNLMGLLYAHFRRLLYCRITPPYADMAGALGVKEFAVKKSRELSQRFTPARLKKICDSFHKADFDFKSGRITDKTALDLFIMQALA